MVESIAPPRASEFYYHDGLNALKFWLMPFVCFASFPFTFPYGEYISGLSLFAPLAFYILCGYISAGSEQEKGFYGRTLKQTAIRFFILLGVFLLLNLAYYAVTGGLSDAALLSLRKRTLFDFAVLCVWPYPIGDTLWFLQALLYARLILWLMDKWKLMRYYKAVMVITVAAMLLFGELAGLIRFQIPGHSFLPGNGITRALPYMLIGRFLYEKRERLMKLSSWTCGALFLLGAAASLGERELLKTTGFLVSSDHLIGYGIMAVAAFCFFLRYEDRSMSFAVAHGRNYSRRIYVFSQPVGHGLRLAAGALAPPFAEIVKAGSGLFVYVICLLLAFLTGYLLYFRRAGAKEY